MDLDSKFQKTVEISQSLNSQLPVSEVIKKADAFDWIEKNFYDIEIFHYKEVSEWRVELFRYGVKYSYTGNSLIEVINKAMK